MQHFGGLLRKGTGRRMSRYLTSTFRLCASMVEVCNRIKKCSMTVFKTFFEDLAKQRELVGRDFHQSLSVPRLKMRLITVQEKELQKTAVFEKNPSNSVTSFLVAWAGRRGGKAEISPRGAKAHQTPTRSHSPALLRADGIRADRTGDAGELPGGEKLDLPCPQILAGKPGRHAAVADVLAAILTVSTDTLVQDKRREQVPKGGNFKVTKPGITKPLLPDERYSRGVI